jgi:uncharacterized protein (DUF4415 family)
VSKKSIKSDLARIDQMKDAEINYADIPPLDKSSLKRATTAWPPVKKQLTIRLDADVLAWLKAQGKGYRLVSRIYGLILVLGAGRACDIGLFPWHRRYGIRKIVWSPLEFCC